MIEETKPWILIGGPPCTDFSVMQRMNWAKMSPGEKRKRHLEARVHLEFCTKLYAIQHEAGRLFLHEHPHGATSWQEPSMMNLKNMKDILHVVADQCEFGLTVRIKGVDKLVKKKTGFLTNSPEVAKELARRCSG